MDDKVFRWRKNHPKCIFCKYYSARRVGIEEVIVQQCIAKDKFLNDLEMWRKEQEYLSLDELIWKIYNDTGYYCETYEVKE